MAEDTTETPHSLFKRWLDEQQAWQKTMAAYADSIATDEEFLTNLGNAMRGSLLAGSPYPTMDPGKPSVQPAPAAGAGGDRIDEVLYAVKELDGRVRDLALTLEAVLAGEGTPSQAPVQRAKDV